MEENELEEGEAYSGEGEEEEEEDGHGSYVDPDSYGYIDEKLQDILGHFQKEFEGAMTVENLGAKMGEYGTFLPSYQRHLPNLSQLRSPRPIKNTMGLQHMPSEGIQKSPPSISRKSAPAVPAVEHLGKREILANTPSNAQSFSQHSSLNKSGNAADQKTLKVRLKMGPENTAKSNAAIYSGLGLDISPSSSFDDSPDGSGGSSPDLEDITVESPKTIIQIMTCFCIPGGFLLSPLQEDLFHLTEKNGSFFRKGKLAMSYANMPEIHPARVVETSFAIEMKGFKEKEFKSGEKTRKGTEVKTSEDKIDMATSLSKDLGTEAPPSKKEYIPGVLDFSMLPVNRTDKKPETQTDGKRSSSKKLDHPKESRKVAPKNSTALPESTVDRGNEVFEAETVHPRGKLNFSSTVDKMSNLNENSFDYQREGQCKVEKDFEPVAESVDNVKHLSSQKTTSRGPDGDKVLQENDRLSDRKIKVESQTQLESFRGSKDNLSSNSMEQRRNSHATVEHAERKPKVPKSRKDAKGDVNVEVLQNGVVPQDFHSKTKQKVEKSEYEKDSSLPNQISKEKSDSKSNNWISGASVKEPMTTALKGNASTDPVVVPQNPIVIEENWVGCDKCHKWRLLPYGTDPSHLPKKWQCSQLNWLPGMNKCDISQDETTEALRALYLVPAPEPTGGLNSHNHVSASGINTTSGLHPVQNVDFGSQTVPPGVKKKQKDVPCPSNLSQFPSSAKKNQQSSAKNKSSEDINQFHIESNSLKVGSTNSSKSSDLGREKKKTKQKDKHKNLVCHSSEGELGGESERHLVAKNKSEVLPDGFRASKKSKTESLVDVHNEFPPDNDISATVGLSSKLTGQNQPKSSEFSLSTKSKSDKNSSLYSSVKNSHGGDHVPSNGEVKEYFSTSDAEKSGNRVLSAKKRKMKDQQENQSNQEVLITSQNAEDGFTTKGVSVETDTLPKRAKLLKSEGKEARASKVNGILDKVTNTNLSQNKECPPDAMAEEEHFDAGEGHQFNQFEEFKRRSDIISSKKDPSCPQSSTAAHSSSSKISGSRKGKSNIPEQKGSPVESVSSSPLRAPGIEKLSSRRMSMLNNESSNVSLPTSGTPKRFLDSNADAANDRVKKNSKETAFSGQQKYLENHSIRGGVSDSEPANHEEINVRTDDRILEDQHDKVLSKHPTSYDCHDMDKLRGQNNRSSNYKLGKNSNFNERHSDTKSDMNDGKLKDSASYIEKKDLPARPDVNCQYEHESAAVENLDAYGSSALPSVQKDSISGIALLHKPSRPSVQEKVKTVPTVPGENEVCHFRSDKNDKMELGTRIGKSNLVMASDDKQGNQTRVHNSVSSPPKGSRSELYSVDAINADSPKVAKQSRHPIQNGTQHNVARQAISNGPDTASPSKKDAVAVYRLRKEARDLKHSANRMKSIGQELESTGVYFEAALKFLHAAFLMETDNLKQGEATQIYHDTAKLCDFVAHEYEKHKEMAAAALAYKCVEVAFLKAAFHKNPHANKDRNELQAALQMLPPGESPSSSASDVDSLNNQATLGKVATIKGVSSPQIAGNYVIASRHHAQVMKLLQYTNDLNCAFEATRKSQNAIAAASASLGKDQVDTLSSVMTVLNFNFHNVEELLRLVRLAQQSIGR